MQWFTKRSKLFGCCLVQRSCQLVAMRNCEFRNRTVAAAGLLALAYGGYDTSFASPNTLKVPEAPVSHNRMQRANSSAVGVIGAGAVAACAAAAVRVQSCRAGRQKSFDSGVAKIIVDMMAKPRLKSSYMHEANEPLQTLEPTPEVAEVSAEERSLDPHSESEATAAAAKAERVILQIPPSLQALPDLQVPRSLPRRQKAIWKLQRQPEMILKQNCTSPGRPTKAGKTGRTKTRALNPDNFSDVCDQTGVTLNRYMIEANRQGVVDTDILSVMNSIREATKVISKLVNTAPLAQAELLGLEGAINVQGEDQKKLDVITNDVLKKALRYTGKLGTMASEEEDMPVSAALSLETTASGTVLSDTGKYVCVFDPLDGSSNVDAGIAVGTIFGIFKESEESNAVCNLPANIKDLDGDQVSCLAATLQPGKALVAAGYVLYSCSTELVFTLGRGVVGFTLDSSIGEYVLTRPNIEIPSRGKIYSCNEANIENWDEPFQDYIRISWDLRTISLYWMVDLAKVFKVYSTQNGMDIRGFIKSMKESGLLDGHFTKVDADLAFCKHTAHSRHTRKIALEDFEQILRCIARRRSVSDQEVFEQAAAGATSASTRRSGALAQKDFFMTRQHTLVYTGAAGVMLNTQSHHA
eukprot:s3208_g3.t4